MKTGLTKTFWIMLLSTVLALGVTPALAANGVDELDFELDGNLIVDSNPGIVDWASMFNVTNGLATPKSTLPGNFGPAAFFRDFVPGGTSDSSTYATGSKDTLNISPGWQCVESKNIGDKTDLLNAYAVAYVNPANNHVILYFGLETASNEGTRDAGFWFLRDPTVGCVGGAKASAFTGNHQDGDILITTEYTGGSGVSSIVAYKWVGGANGQLTASPIATGGDCKTNSAGATLCGTTNGNPGGTALLASLGQVPWLTQTKVQKSSSLTSADLDVAEFFEGAIDLTANGISGCFTKYLANTRSSTSPTATIFDYAVGSFPLCGISVGKACTGTPSTPDGSTLVSTFNVAINTTGPGAQTNVTLAENVTLNAGEGCAIFGVTAPTGATVNSAVANASPQTPVYFSGTTAITIFDSQPGNTTGTVQVVCATIGRNPFLNAVKVESSEGSGTHTVSTAEACPFVGNPSIVPTKCCTGVKINPTTLLPQACVKITVTKTTRRRPRT